jgi:hypothetical protein
MWTHGAAAAAMMGLALAATLRAAQAPGDTWVRYVDPEQRFEFAYPAAGRTADSATVSSG